LRSKLAPGTRCALEHGGAAPAIVDRSAELDQVIEPMVKGGYCHAGQVRVSTQRIFVHADVQAEFVDRFVARVRALRVGDPLATETEVGPLIHPREADRVQSWIEEAAAGGARIVVGGERGAAGHPAICRRGGTLPTTCHPCRHGHRWTHPSSLAQSLPRRVAQPWLPVAKPGRDPVTRESQACTRA